MSLKREKLLHIGKSFLFLRDGEELAHSSLSLTINWKAEKETVISFVKNMYVEKPFRSTGRAMWWWSAVVVRAFGPLSILPAAYANYQAFFSYLWVSSLMISLYQLKPYSPGTLTHRTVWSAHMLPSAELAGKYSCICINYPLLIQVQIKMKIKLIRLGEGLCFDLSPIQIRNNSAEAGRVILILTQCEIRPRSTVSAIKVFIFA